VLLSGNGALRAVIDRLNARFVRVDDERIFTNVNTPADYDAVRGVIA
jgi:molybdopterin-guanine dinucleotide biosynthesis protein A